jgi:outer membrane protein assembly factor BamB
VFPPVPEWKTLVGEVVVAPLAADSRHVYVATRDGAVRALDPLTGEIAWSVQGLPGRLSAAEGILLVRGEQGALTSVHPRTGAVRWSVETAVAGTLPAVIDGDRAIVAGAGVAAVLLDGGSVAWSDSSGTETTAPPLATTARLITGERDGTLRCRDRASGASLWTLRTGEMLLAPPLVQEARRRLYLGTTDRRILEVTLDKGRRGWAWRVGADIGVPGIWIGRRLLFASFDATLYALETGGNLFWRAALPSRPLAAPLAVDGHVLVACLENELVAFNAETGARAGSFKTAAEIRTPPIRAGKLVVLGLRDRSVIAYALAAAAPPRVPAPLVEPPSPGR